MVLLKHGDFEFSKLLSSGYNIVEDKVDVLSSATMADGSVRRNYGKMPKTNIRVKFSQLNKDTYQEYMSHFLNSEDVYSYFSPKQQKMITKKFFVTFPETSVISTTKDHRYDEFEVSLEQCGEVST